MNVVHRDLKLENVLFYSKNDFRIKVIDFGSSELYNKNSDKNLTENLMIDTVGTAYYIAPEVLNG